MAVIGSGIEVARGTKMTRRHIAAGEFSVAHGRAACKKIASDF
jgi:hypothetical protein